MVSTKEALRERIWSALTAKGVARFPGAYGRIPNFEGAETAAQLLTLLDIWRNARTLKSNPDMPQRPVRFKALKAGKIVYMAVPRLRERNPFIELDPRVIGEADLWKASSIEGAFSMGRSISLDQMLPVDLIMAGSVAVSLDGARLGKGGGYSDLEYALAREAGLVSDKTPIVTTVHAIQIVDEGEIEITAHDVSLDWIITPEGAHPTNRSFPQPRGIQWEILGQKLDEIPVLQELARIRG